MDWIRKQCSLLELNHNLSHSNKHTRLNTRNIQHAYASTTHRPQPTLKANRHLTIGDKKATGGSTVSACKTDHTLLWCCWKIEQGAICNTVSDLFLTFTFSGSVLHESTILMHHPTWRNSGTWWSFSDYHKNPLFVTQQLLHRLFRLAGSGSVQIRILLWMSGQHG